MIKERRVEITSPFSGGAGQRVVGVWVLLFISSNTSCVLLITFFFYSTDREGRGGRKEKVWKILIVLIHFPSAMLFGQRRMDGGEGELVGGKLAALTLFRC
jgi:hypothetical protein